MLGLFRRRKAQRQEEFDAKQFLKEEHEAAGLGTITDQLLDKFLEEIRTMGDIHPRNAAHMLFRLYAYRRMEMEERNA